MHRCTSHSYTFLKQHNRNTVKSFLHGVRMCYGVIWKPRYLKNSRKKSLYLKNRRKKQVSLNKNLNFSTHLMKFTEDINLLYDPPRCQLKLSDVLKFKFSHRQLGSSFCVISKIVVKTRCFENCRI